MSAAKRRGSRGSEKYDEGGAVEQGKEAEKEHSNHTSHYSRREKRML